LREWADALFAEAARLLAPAQGVSTGEQTEEHMQAIQMRMTGRRLRELAGEDDDEQQQ
jgi:hypothetical protein